MFLNQRMMSPELLHLKALEGRSKLSSSEKYKIYILERGFEGEILYDKIFEEVGHNHLYIYRDLYLRIENSVTQYDSLIISDDGIVVNEIKHYSGDYHYKEGQFYRNNKSIRDNAFYQLNRATGKLIKLRDEAGMTFNVSGKVIFPNDEFRLHSEDHSIWKNVVLRSGLREYFRGFNNYYAGEYADKIVHLIKNRIVENPYFNDAAEMERLRRGLYCGKCASFNLIKGRFQLTCSDCGSIESNETHLLRAMSDFKYLFYNQPMSREALLELINHQFHKSTVYRAIRKHCLIEQKGNSTTYTLKYYNSESGFQETREKQRYKDKIK